MPIRVAPWEAISENDIVALKARGVPESQTMEYKRGCDLDDREQRFEFVKDVTAMANAAGGTIVYGVEEGEGEEQGFIVSFPGMSGSPGEFHERVDNLLQTSVDERIPGVLHRAVEREHGGFYYLVRIPSSLLAPHMIVMRTSNPRFHARGTQTCQPMNARQVKTAALRADSVFERARTNIELRMQTSATIWTRRIDKPTETGSESMHVPGDSLLCHAITLLGEPFSVDLADPKLGQWLSQRRLWNNGSSGQVRYSIDGYHLGYPTGFNGPQHELLVTNSGMLEVREIRPLRDRDGELVMNPPEIEGSVMEFIRLVEEFTGAGVLRLPLVLSMRLVNAMGSRIAKARRIYSTPNVEQQHLSFEPVVITDMTVPLSVQLRRLLDSLWQAYGQPRCPHYSPEGVYRRDDRSGFEFPY